MIDLKILHYSVRAIVVMLFLVGCNIPNASQATQVPPSPTQTPKPPPPTPFIDSSSVELIGEEETVYSYANDRCADNIVPDLPIRVFRNAEGMIQLNLSSPTNYRMIGPDLDSLELDCNPTLTSDSNPDPSQFSHQEWMGSPYTLDGETVYALIHNEYYGAQGSTWDANRDFFDAEQGSNNWRYQSWNSSNYKDMTFSAHSDRWQSRWQGPRSLCQIYNWGAHPDQNCDPTRTWVSPVTDMVTVTGRAWDNDPGGGDGVIVTLLKGDVVLWSQTIENGNQEGFHLDLQVPVNAGDSLHFRVSARGNPNNDATAYELEINVGPDPCGPGMKCDYHSITYAVSNDGGKTFTQPPAPDHLVATLPFQYQPNEDLIANWQPSNIVKSPSDDYYYALFELDINRPGSSWFQGTCVIRTKTLDDPKSWRAWDGEDFNMRFINPYLEPDADPEEHTCQVVPVSNYGALSYNLTYNTYFEKFVAVGQVINVLEHGFYYSLSDDLIHWTPVKLLMAGNLDNTKPYIAYPSLVDPDNKSLNYDVTGQSPYLYFSRFQRPALEDIDLLRIRVQFSK